MFYLKQFRLNKWLNQSDNYHGYDGFAIFARDMDLAINNPSWKLIGTPWKKEEAPATTQVAKAKAAA
ncbi:nitrogenase molybdenum-iron protein alpha chain [Calothrix parasitica NIES-267]|uniref:Nitrogenase molybdenum-iron protein alpha chain n=1 Tax=Calothrix parasitica NIES-267 TaxID=1973488 RepID=A0A1Z4LXQ5_9CYAN|nr:nitrogenase molybdenum-iron protein alpha chain [Calothrix parasitica NIES-267]